MGDPGLTTPSRVLPISVVIPVYGGERTLGSVIEELLPYRTPHRTPGGHTFVIDQIVLVHDNGPDRSDEVIRSIADRIDIVSVVWLSRNFGQHAATIAGMAESSGTWIVTMDEDGQHDPAAIPDFLDTAIGERAGVVYARFTNVRPHGALRNWASETAKKSLSIVFGTPSSIDFQSFRMIRGDVGRRLASFASTGVYLDVALSWVTSRVRTVSVRARGTDQRESSYTLLGLFAYFWSMVLTSGTRGLRVVSGFGGALALAGVAMAVYVIIASIVDPNHAEGWPSLMVVTLICTGAILLALGIVAEYIGVLLNVSMGRPLYVRIDDPGTTYDAPVTPERPLREDTGVALLPGEKISE